MERFEYLKLWNIDDKRLNELGKIGWELISCNNIEERGECYLFKRTLDLLPNSRSEFM